MNLINEGWEEAAMKKSSATRSTDHPTKSQKQRAVKKSAAAQLLGGQPENDHDARAAGFESATARAPGKASIPGPYKVHGNGDG